MQGILSTRVSRKNEIIIQNIKTIDYPNANSPEDSINDKFSLEYNTSQSKFRFLERAGDFFVSDIYRTPVNTEINNDHTYLKIDKIINYKNANYKVPNLSLEYITVEILGYVNTKNIMKDQIKKYIYSTFIDIDRTIDNFN